MMLLKKARLLMFGLRNPSPFRFYLSFAALLLVPLGSLWMTTPRESPAPPPAFQAEAVPRQVTISARDRRVEEILHSFADQIGARLVLEGDFQGRMSIEARESDLDEVMENLCTALECQWLILDKPTPSLVVSRL